jgi:hypothetical protein
MKLHIRDINLHIDTSFLDDPNPKTAQEQIQWANDAISEVNNRMKRQYGISLTAFVEDGDITTEA